MRSFLTDRRTVRAASVLALALGAGVALPAALSPTRGDPAAPAMAVAGGQVEYRAAPGQNNRVTVTELPVGNYAMRYVIDDVVPIVAGKGCAYPSDADRTKVSCTARYEEMTTDPVRTLVLQLGDGEDTAEGHAVDQNKLGYTEINLGSGNDTWTGTGREALHVFGGPGDDTITTSGYSTIDGGAGDDTLHGSGDVSVLGGAGDDVLQGGEGTQSLVGQQGDDSIHGGPGDDLLSGNEGNDVLYGDDGDDLMWGESQVGNGFQMSRDEKLGKKRDDKLYGGPGTDKLYGGPGPDALYGGPGTDQLDGGTSPNTVVQD
ncbi:calcium-binding protein [Streptomyces sp. NBC_01092]|uniref:calcium-binding protein n=1 Tax=Streptomyces sp. NBC_01092 TaxID=2903748 RepID=UPI003863D465|nr:calcium-binding protein [Streptomyces sp. NBC_01092]